MKVKVFFIAFLILLFKFSSSHAQTTVKKVMPKQVYGNVNAKRRADSLAVIRKMKEIEQEANLKGELEEKNDTQKPEVVNEEKVAESDIQSAKTTIEEKDIWSLQRCVQYARDNNLTVQSAILNERLAALQLQQSKDSRLPNINADASLGDSYGRSIDPTTNQFVTKGFIYNTLGLSTQALLFGWFQRKYQNQQNLLEMQASAEANNQLKDDIALNVATGFLRVLLAREQVKISEAQLALDKQQYEQTVKFANSGKIPELNVAQMSSQSSSDSATWVSNQSEARLALLQLKALLNFSFEKPFDIKTPEIDIFEMANTYTLATPAVIYETAIQNQHRMKFNQLKLASAKKALYIAKSAQYPQLSIFGNLGTNFSTNVKKITGQNYIGETPIGNVNVNGNNFPITVPNYTYNTATQPLFDQYGQNIRANAGLSLNIPILNGNMVHNNMQRARIGIQSQQIALEQDQQKLKQDIYTAYEQSKSAAQKYAASNRAKEAAERSLEFAVKRYAIGMINTFEFTSIQNSFNTACSSVLLAKYDLIFKQKVLDYYMGKPLKL